MRAAKSKGLVYFKVDHHWTPLGAYQGYKLVMNNINKKYANIHPIPENQYKITSTQNATGYGYLFNLLFPDGRYINKAYSKKDFYQDFKYISSNSISGEWQNFYQDKSFASIYNSKGYKKKIFLLGDSFLSYYYPFFTHTFYETFCYLKKEQINMSKMEDLVLSHKPDILIMNIYADNVILIKNWYKTEKK